MAVANIQDHLKPACRQAGFVPAVKDSPEGTVRLSCDAEADTLYVNRKPSLATEGDITDDDVIMRYEGEEVVGLTILRASKR